MVYGIEKSFRFAPLCSYRLFKSCFVHMKYKITFPVIHFPRWKTSLFWLSLRITTVKLVCDFGLITTRLSSLLLLFFFFYSSLAFIFISILYFPLIRPINVEHFSLFPSPSFSLIFTKICKPSKHRKKSVLGNSAHTNSLISRRCSCECVYIFASPKVSCLSRSGLENELAHRVFDSDVMRISVHVRA